MRHSRAVHRLLFGVVILCGLVATVSTAGAATRHHITLGIGYTKMLSDDFKDDVNNIDLTNAANAVLAYRYSLNSQFDLTIDSRATASAETYQGVDLTATVSYFGPGIRWRPAGAAPLYLQGNVFFVNEEAEAQQGNVIVKASEGGTGFGVMGGVDLRITPLLSVPIEMNYLYAKPADDVSGLGFTIGLAWNFGQMP